MPSKTFHLSGHVIHQQSQRGIPNVRVEAWDKDLIFDTLVSSAVTDQQGQFQITFTEEHFQACFPDRQPDLFFKVFTQKNRLIASTENSVLWNVNAEAITVLIEVDLPLPNVPKPEGELSEQFVVKGTILQADGRSMIGTVVRASDRDLRHEQRLGEKRTDRAGHYEITYTRAQFCRAEKGSADLIVRVYDGATGQLLAKSDIIFNAKPIEIVDLTVIREDQTRSLYERLMVELHPLLGEQAIRNLREDTEEKPAEGKYRDITFLSGETGFEKNVLARLVMAHKLTQQAIQPEFWFALLGGSFYQYIETQNLDRQFEASLDSLASLDAAAVRKALTRSFNQNEISTTFQAIVDRWVEAFLQFVASRTVSESDKPTFVKLALEDAGIQGAEKQAKFARLFNQYKTLTPELLGALAQDPSFTQPEIADLRTSFQLADLTRSDFSVVKAVKEEFGIRQPEQIRTLAKRSEGEWVNLITTRYAAGELDLPFEVSPIAEQASLPEAEVYGKMLDRQFREAFPTIAFTGGLERALQNGGTHGLRRAQDINRFLDRHESFEFLNTSVDDFLNDNIQPDFQLLATDEAFKQELKTVQRILKLAPTFEATDALLADDLHSAQKIYRLGESEFVRQYGDRPGFTPETARLAWNRAADTHAAVLTIVADLKALEAEALPMALKNNSEALSTFPNWNNLFQTGDLCECEHCRSVLGPAAYFADLLMFLKDRDTRTGNGKVKDVLFRRRPDLGFLELNCDNALVPLPYIDVVCEVLEAALDATGENDLELTGFTAIPADPAAAKTAVTAAFQNAFGNPINDGKQKIELGSNFSLSQVIPSDPDRWVAHGDDVTYLLKKKATPNFFAGILRNTKASAAELRAYSQYVNPKAYEKLKTARYPITLPFDLFAEEVRAAFQKTNLQRWDLMRVFRGSTAPTDSDIAAEYFGISISANPTDLSEKNLILVAEPTETGQQEIWGEVGNADWLNPNPITDAEIKNAVGNVKKFLQKTNLEYNELLVLLDLKFINPTGNITIRHFDPSCDTDKKVILVLDGSALDRIHRFLRLWRKLKTWKMWELDLVIRHPRIGNEVLNEAFLVNLFYFSEIKQKLGGKTTVEQVCALFDDLNTETRFTKLHEKREDALFQNLFLNKRLIQPLDPAFQLDPATGDLPTGETITTHHPVILSALGIREADLVLIKELTKASDGTRYITDDLTLANLSFLWRHAWLSKLLKFKVEDWKLVLKIFPHEVPAFADLAAKQSFLENKYYIKTAGLSSGEIDGLLQKIFYREVLDFACPKSAFEFLEKIDHLKASGFTPDELNWLLAGDRTAKAVIKEADAVRFLTTLRQELQRIKAEFAIAIPTDEDGSIALLTSLLQRLNRSETETETFITIVRNGVTVSSTPAEFIVKFYEPKFSASLTNLPTTIDFETQLPDELAAKIAYNVEQRLLHFSGIMSNAEQSTLLTLSNDAAYVAALNSLATQPQRSWKKSLS